MTEPSYWTVLGSVSSPILDITGPSRFYQEVCYA